MTQIEEKFLSRVSHFHTGAAFRGQEDAGLEAAFVGCASAHQRHEVAPIEYAAVQRNAHTLSGNRSLTRLRHKYSVRRIG